MLTPESGESFALRRPDAIMNYEKLQFSFSAVDKAGAILRDWGNRGADEKQMALSIMQNYRAAHTYPLNGLYTTLRSRARKLDKTALAAQRLKRFESVFIKLMRNKSMQLSQMQDIGGCRAVL
jgi:hypothetical protein